MDHERKALPPTPPRGPRYWRDACDLCCTHGGGHDFWCAHVRLARWIAELRRQLGTPVRSPSDPRFVFTESRGDIVAQARAL